MAEIKPPKYVRQVLFTLQSRGYPAYLVGGCVRDMLLGQRPNDWDVCTGALPEQVLSLFPGSRPTGAQHGTVTVVVGSRQVEVTTFRAEGAYSDHRHPDAVRFVADLTADLSRRDFTMNAIAVSADGLFADPFGGVGDIRSGLIRCVGVPEQRFEEDALRMLRALRFSAKLGFSVDLITLEAIREKAPLAATLAAERVRDELEKTLLSGAPETLFTMSELGLLDAYLDAPIPADAPLGALRQLPRRRGERWACLGLILLRCGSAESLPRFLTRLKLDKRTVDACEDVARMLAAPAPKEPRAWKRLLARYGVDAVSIAARCADALDGGGHYRSLRQVLKSGECFSLRHLAVTGDDLTALGLRGRDVGDTLRFLLDYVIDYPANNQRELLLALADRSGEE